VATIRITPKFPLVMFAIRMSSLRVSIDEGQEQEVSVSKSTDVTVPAGSHHVEMYFPWALPAKMGPAEIDLSLGDDEVVELRYKPPWIRTQPGRLSVIS
jgi:hypothetical protein